MKHLSELKQILKVNLGWHQQRIDCLARLMLALIKVRTVNLTQIACAYGGKAQVSSSYRRLQRFFSQFTFSQEQIATLIFGLFFSR